MLDFLVAYGTSIWIYQHRTLVPHHRQMNLLSSNEEDAEFQSHGAQTLMPLNNLLRVSKFSRKLIFVVFVQIELLGLYFYFKGMRDCTPVKGSGPNSPLKNAVVRRSTPRKRLLLSDPKEMICSPDKTKTRVNWSKLSSLIVWICMCVWERLS